MGASPISYDAQGRAFSYQHANDRAPSRLPASDIPPPPPLPDLTDEVVRRAQLAAARRLQMGNGLAASFLTGPLGLTKSGA